MVIRFTLALLCVLALSAPALEIAVKPDQPTIEDVVEIEIRGCTQSGTLHWGVNAEGGRWEQPLPEYRPVGFEMWGVAVRTPLEGPDKDGICRARLGPFINTNQPVRAINFAIQWKDGTWSNKDEKNFLVSVSYGRITWSPQRPSVNDPIEVRVQNSSPGGFLRWGVNSENDLWKTPMTNYWPKGSHLADDRLGVDSPLSRPDSNGVSIAVLGPFDQPEQIVRTLHLAAHWGKVWETDASRNYNLSLALDEGDGQPLVRFHSPSNGEIIVDAPNVVLQAEDATEVDMWLNGRNVATLREAPFELRVPFRPLKYGQHHITARARRDGKVGMGEIMFWKVPPHIIEAVPEGTSWGATENGDGTVTFALHAPGKLFVSLAGDFNGWDTYTNMLKYSPDGTWWLTRPVPKGTWKYQFCIEGQRLLADPYARDIEWKDAQGREGYQPQDARAVLTVGQPAYAWTAQPYERPKLGNLSIYEFHIDDLCPGQGFTGVIAKLDYIRNLGVTAIEPLPFNEFTLDHSWGYNPSYHFAPESAYGTPDQLRRLIDETHKRGMAFIMDLVMNHMDRNSSLYQLYGGDFEGSPFFRQFLGENWGFPDLDHTSKAGKRYDADIVQFWLRSYRVDGFRYDATRWVEWDGYNNSGASWLAFAGRAADRTSIHIAEHLPSDPDLINQTEMDTGWGDSFHWPMSRMITGASLDRDEFERAMDPRRIGYTNAEGRVAYIESHDEERLMHDLRRAGFAADECYRRAELGMALTVLAPGPVMIYSGQEFGEDTPKQVGSNPLQWSKMRQPPARRMVERTATLLKLRNTHPAFASDQPTFQLDGQPRDVAVMQRGEGTNAVILAANFGKTAQSPTLSLPADANWHDLLDPAAGPPATFTLQPGQARVLARR